MTALIWTAAAGAVFVYMTGAFLFALWRRDNSVADVAWGPGCVVAGAAAMAAGPGFTPRALLVMALVSVWAIRLAVHIGARRQVQGEDFRYARWRERWGRHWVVRSFLQVFLLQGAILLVVALPVILVVGAPATPLGVLDVLGAGLWLAGLGWESVADAQLARFRRESANRGRLLTTGLWRYSRHPNYFGEAVLWWGIGVIALAVPGGWLGLLGPAVLTVLLVKVSGVPMLERGHLELRPGYGEYVATTNAFVPWRRRRAVVVEAGGGS